MPADTVYVKRTDRPTKTWHIFLRYLKGPHLSALTICGKTIHVDDETWKQGYTKHKLNRTDNLCKSCSPDQPQPPSTVPCTACGEPAVAMRHGKEVCWACLLK